jgi:hypothetical protein
MSPEIKSTHRLRTIILALVAAATLIISTLPASAQEPDQQPSAASITPTADSSTATPTNIDQLIPLTVSEAWQMSGKNEAKFFDIVQQLAAFSAEKRGLTLPDTAAAGKRAGEYIKMQAKADHDQLLYAIVDRAVRHVGTKTAAGQ